MSFPSNLDVPLEYQEDDVSCVPVCMKMILEFIRRENPTGYIPNMNVEEISQTVGTDELGTPLENIEKINEKLGKAVPSVEFVAELNCSFREIENEILEGKPVIAWVKIPHPHSIVVTGLNKDSLIVYYNDPELGKKQIEMGKFVSSWNQYDNVLIKVKIGGKIQRIIPEYAQKKEQQSGRQ
jgi:ABC-type bacteriocin/lantibiotic exporter with double-glycine peptidase domain